MEAVDLSSFSVNSEIDSLFLNSERLVVVQLDGVSLRARRGNEGDVESIHQFVLTSTGIATPVGKEDGAGAPNINISSVPTVSSLTRDLSSEVIQCNQVFPVYILLEKQKENGQWQVCALAQCSFGYSTWKGRVLNLNTFIPGAYEEIAMRCIIKTAEVLGCSRIVFQMTDKDIVKSFCTKHHAEDLSGWLTLQMSKDAMTSFLATKVASGGNMKESNRLEEGGADSNISAESSPVPFPDVVNTVLSEMNSTTACKDDGNDKKQIMKLRLAQREDAASIFKLVNGLAVYEKAANEVAVTSEIYKRDGCGTDHPIFHCILVELQDTNCDQLRVVGMGFFYLGYSVCNGGKYLYLEDLFIEEEYRGRGCGKSIMLSLADIASRSCCSRFVWQALDWNTPALKFYQAIGANICDGLVTVRLNEDQIKR